MYREFRELEGKIASFSEAGPAISAETDPAAEANDRGPLERAMADAEAVDSAGTGAGAGTVGDNMDVLAIKKERDAKKRDIKQWIKEFEEREGHTPTAK